MTAAAPLLILPDVLRRRVTFRGGRAENVVLCKFFSFFAPSIRVLITIFGDNENDGITVNDVQAFRWNLQIFGGFLSKVENLRNNSACCNFHRRKSRISVIIESV